MAPQHTSYAWSRHTDTSAVPDVALTHTARIGLACARELAAAAVGRSRQNLRSSRTRASAATLAALAAAEGVSSNTLRRWIREARQAYFDQLSDAAIYKREQRQRHSHRKRIRRCEHPGC